MEAYCSDKYEADNLIWQLDVTIKKLSTICDKNAKLVDYITKKVAHSVAEWNASKENFAKLSWAEMDDSDLDLDLDIATDDEGEASDQDTLTVPDAAADISAAASVTISLATHTQPSNTLSTVSTSTSTEGDREEMGVVQQKLLKHQQQLAQTEKSELEKSEKLKRQQLQRMQNAAKRKQKRHEMLKQKHQKLTFKLMEIKHNDNLEKQSKYKEMRQKQLKAQQFKQKLHDDKRRSVLQVQVDDKVWYARNVHSSGDDDGDDAHNERKYVDTTAMTRLSSKFLYIPRIVRKSSASALYPHIERLYNNTNALLVKRPALMQKSLSPSSQSQHDTQELTGILRTWSNNTQHIDFSDTRHDKDVLLVLNRLTHFDINRVDTQSGRVLLRILIALARNQTGLELFSCKYISQLLTYYSTCVTQQCANANANAAVGDDDDDAVSHCRQICVLLTRVFAYSYTEQTPYKHDKTYLKFKRQIASFVLLNAYKSGLFKVACSTLQSQAECDSFDLRDVTLDMLQEIANLLQHGQGKFVKEEICKLIHHEFDKTTVLDMLLSFVDSYVSQAAGVDFSFTTLAKCFEFLSTVLKSNAMNRALLLDAMLKHKVQVRRILIAFCQRVQVCFETEPNADKLSASMFDAVRKVLQFITIATLENRAMQDLCSWTPHAQTEPSTILACLCNLPFYFLLHSPGQNALFPALIAVTFKHATNVALMNQSLNVKHLQLWITKALKMQDESETVLPTKLWPVLLQFYDQK